MGSWLSLPQTPTSHRLVVTRLTKAALWSRCRFSSRQMLRFQTKLPMKWSFDPNVSINKIKHICFSPFRQQCWQISSNSHAANQYNNHLSNMNIYGLVYTCTIYLHACTHIHCNFIHVLYMYVYNTYIFVAADRIHFGICGFLGMALTICWWYVVPVSIYQTPFTCMHPACMLWPQPSQASPGGLDHLKIATQKSSQHKIKIIRCYSNDIPSKIPQSMNNPTVSRLKFPNVCERQYSKKSLH